MRIAPAALHVLAALVLIAGCGEDSEDPNGPEGGDDALVFANSSGIEVTVEMSVNGVGAPDVVLPPSTMAGETRVDVSFIEGHAYTFQFLSAATAIKSSSPLTCTVDADAEADGVASVLVFVDSLLGALTAQCLQNWVESPT